MLNVNQSAIIFTIAIVAAATGFAILGENIQSQKISTSISSNIQSQDNSINPSLENQVNYNQTSQQKIPLANQPNSGMNTLTQVTSYSEPKQQVPSNLELNGSPVFLSLKDYGMWYRDWSIQMTNDQRIFYITTDPFGNIFFALDDGPHTLVSLMSDIVKLNPANGKVTMWPTEYITGNTNQLYSDSSGNIYFQQYPSIISKLEPASNKITEWDDTTTIFSMTKDPFNNVYAEAEALSPNLKKIELSTGKVTRWGGFGGVLEIKSDSLGNVYSERYGGQGIERFDMHDKFKAWALQKIWQSLKEVDFLNFDSSGNVYFKLLFLNTPTPSIAKLDPSSGIITRWDLPIGTRIGMIVTDSTGNIYFTEETNKIGKLEPVSGKFIQWTIPVPHAIVTGNICSPTCPISSSFIAIDSSSGKIYFTEPDINRIGVLSSNQLEGATAIGITGFQISQISSATYSVQSITFTSSAIPELTIIPQTR